MEEQSHPQRHGYSTTTIPPETNDHKFTAFMGKEEEKSREDLAMIDHDFVDKHEGMGVKEKHTLFEELHRTRSSSSSVKFKTKAFLSSSDEEIGGGGGKKRKRKGLKDKIKEKMSPDKDEECTDHKDTFITVDKCDNQLENEEATDSEKKKGFLHKIKERLQGPHKKTEEGTVVTAANQEDSPGCDQIKEKKGILDKVEEKAARTPQE